MSHRPAEWLRARRRTILASLDNGSMLLPSAPHRTRSGDSEYRYRPDSDLLYVTGWERPGCVVLLRGFADEDRFVVFAPERDPKAELWTGQRPDHSDIRSRLGADQVYPLGELDRRTPELLEGGDVVYYRLGASGACDRVVRETLERGRRRRALRGGGARMLADPGVVLDPMRRIKDDREIARMKSAADITVASFRDALAMIGAGVGEWEIEAALESGFRQRGAGAPAFATIVAGGANACTLHYTDNSGTLEAGGLVLMDAGAEFRWYAADVTRTVPVSGSLAGARRDAYEVVRAAHGAAIEACAAGDATLACAHEAASRVIAEGLIELGVLTVTVDEALEKGSHNEFFPHRTSHWLGLDTHDVGDYRDGGGAVRLCPGMVFTVEPGLYFAPGSCSGNIELEGTGIRLEDDVLITGDGIEVLTGGLPVALDELAALVGRGPRPTGR